MTNATRSRVDFLASDWFGQVNGQFDLMVSNPPYIAEADAPGPAVRAVAGLDIGRGRPGRPGIIAQAPSICRPAAGCCWSMATTRVKRCAPCSPDKALSMFSPGRTCRASNAAQWQVERNGGIITYRTPSVEFNQPASN
jgi:hypothetical protein